MSPLGATSEYTTDTEPEQVFSEKDLAIVIDTDLTFEDHVAEKIRKENSIVETKTILTTISNVCMTNPGICSSFMVSSSM